MSINSDYARNVAQIMANSAAARANAQRQSGQIWGQTLSNVGQIAGETISHIAAQKKKETDDQKVRDLFASPEMPSPSKILSSLGPERGVPIINALQSLKTKIADPVEEADKRAKVIKNTMLGLNAVPDDVRAQAYPAVRQGLIANGVITEKDAPPEYDANWWNQAKSYGQEPPAAKPVGVAQITTTDANGKPVIKFVEEKAGAEYPVAPPKASDSGVNLGSFEDYVGRYATAKGKQVDALTTADIEDARKRYMRADDKPTGGGGSNSGLVDAVMANPNLYSTLTPTAKTAITAELARRGFKGFDQPGAGKPPTGAQNKALSFFNRAKQASDDMQSIEGEIAKMGLGGQTRMALAPNFAQTQTGQLYNQAQRAFTEARLRKDSGAAIPDSEFANDRRTYFVQPGDSPETIAQKARARAGVLASIAFEAGPALHQFYGDDADAMIESYKDRAKRPDAKTAEPPDYGLRPDGTKKGDGFFGALRIPGTDDVASEYSIADSEKLKDAKGNYIDYPTLVPTLTEEEVRQVLAAAKNHTPVPASVARKAESFALERRAKGLPLFAQPGEQRSLYPNIARGSAANTQTSGSKKVGRFVVEEEP